MRRSVLLVGALALVGIMLAAGASGSAGSVQVAAVRGVLVVEASRRVTILSLAGKRLPVPARVRESPVGLSPDTRLVAGNSDDSVLMGVSGGSMTAVLRGNSASPPCPFGADPSYAWSPDSQQLAAAANTPHGPTMLKFFNRGGQVVRSFTLPNGNPEQGARVYHHLSAWSPDGSRLLLLQSNDYGPTAAVVLDIKTGRLRTLAPLHFCSDPSLAWSPDGRLLALTEQRACQDGPTTFSVIDAASAKPIVQCSEDPTGCNGGTAWTPGGTVWAQDSRSVFGTVVSKGASRIDRFYLTGRRTNVIKSSAGSPTPHVAFVNGLVYQAKTTHGRAVLYLHRFTTGHHETLISSPSTMTVLPLSHIP